MKTIKIIIYTLFFIFSFPLVAQVGFGGGMESAGMLAYFSAPELTAYQESSQTKTEDFYQYLEWISDPTLSVSLRQQAKETMYSLFKEAKVQVLNLTDFASDSPSRISLTELITRMEKEKKQYSFKVIRKEELSQDIFPEYWYNTYILEIKKGKKIKKISVKQKIYFQPENKNFGKENRKIWTLLLGEME